MSRGRVVAGVATLAVLLAGLGAVFLVRGQSDYSHDLVRYSDKAGEANRYLDLPDGEAQLAFGSPDGHRLVVQWRDPDGHGWTAPETVFTDTAKQAIDSTIRAASGTVAISQLYTPDTSDEEGAGNVTVLLVCRERTCTPGYPYPSETAEPQVTPDGRNVYFAGLADTAVLWTAKDGIHEEPWSGLPDDDPDVRSVSTPVLSPDGVLRVVTSRPGRGSCTFVLLSSSPGDAAMTEVGRATVPLRGSRPSDCRAYLDTFSADWVTVHPDDHRAASFWFVRDGAAWTTTQDDPSGLVPIDVTAATGCCGLTVSGFIHWNDLAYGSPDGGRHLSVQTHFQGEPTWEERQLLDGAPAGYRCTWLDGGQVGDGFVLVLTCRSQPSDDIFEGDAYAVAATPDLRHWDSRFVTDVTSPPDVGEDGVSVPGRPYTWWTPGQGFGTLDLPQPLGSATIRAEDGTFVQLRLRQANDLCTPEVVTADEGDDAWSEPVASTIGAVPAKVRCAISLAEIDEAGVRFSLDLGGRGTTVLVRPADGGWVVTP